MSDTPKQCAAQSTTLGATSEAPHPPSHAKNLSYSKELKKKMMKLGNVDDEVLVMRLDVARTRGHVSLCSRGSRS